MEFVDCPRVCFADPPFRSVGLFGFPHTVRSRMYHAKKALNDALVRGGFPVFGLQFDTILLFHPFDDEA
jgi:hypothetical protein